MKIIKLLTCGAGLKPLKINAIFKNLLFYSWASSSQIVGMIVISIEPSTKMVRDSGPRAELCCIYSESILLLKNL
jgi:hypothetical protein